MTDKRVIIIHGWEGAPERSWFPWLKTELEERGFEVIVPRLPDSEDPRIEKWLPAVAKACGRVDCNTIFVGHSMGCQTIVRYLVSLPEGTKCCGAVFVAGFFKRLTNSDGTEEERETCEHWLGTPIDLPKAARTIKQSVAIFSDDDPFVPLDNQDDFRTLLNSQIIIEHNMKHFSQSDGITKLPLVLEQVLKMAGDCGKSSLSC